MQDMDITTLGAIVIIGVITAGMLVLLVHRSWWGK